MTSRNSDTDRPSASIQKTATAGSAWTCGKGGLSAARCCLLSPRYSLWHLTVNVDTKCQRASHWASANGIVMRRQLINARESQQTTDFLTHIYSFGKSSVFSDYGAWQLCASWLLQQTKVFR